MDSPSSTWKTAKEFMDWENSSGPPDQLSVNGKLITKAAQIASEMNSFFINKVKVIREGIRFIPNTFSKCLEIMNNKQCKLSFHHVTVPKVNKLLKKLKNSRSSSLDELDNYCVKIAADVIDQPLHHIPLHKKHNKLETCCNSVSLEQDSGEDSL